MLLTLLIKELMSSFCRQHHKHVEMAEEIVFEGYGANISYNAIHCLLVCIYRSPGSDFRTFYNKIKALLVFVSKKTDATVIAGDFNIDMFHDNPRQCDFSYTLLSFGVQIVTKEPTRVCATTSSCLDTFFLLPDRKTTVDLLHAGTISTSFSDHKYDVS